MFEFIRPDLICGTFSHVVDGEFRASYYLNPNGCIQVIDELDL